MTPSSSPTRLPSAPLRYKLDFSDTRSHTLGVELQFDPAGQPVDLVMPQMSPGSPTNSLGHPLRISGVQARDARGAALELRKTGAGRWNLEAQASGPVSVHYKVKADEFSHVRSYLSDCLAYVNGPSALMMVDGRQSQAATLELCNFPSQNWKVTSTLEAVPGRPDVIYASSYADLADSNLLAGSFASVSEQVGGTTLQVNQNGVPPWPNLKVNGATPEQSLQDLKGLYSAFTREFGEFPRQRSLHSAPLPAEVEAGDHYTVTKHYLHGKGPNAGGYEHYHGHELLLHAAAEGSILTRFDGDGRAHERHIMAHELMHKLLAKFVRHEEIDSSHLDHVGSCDGLWLSEGGVEWAASALQRSAGQITPEQNRRMLQDQMRAYLTAYAQDPTSARDNSFDAHLGNNGFYIKGAVTTAMLDLQIRAATEGQRGMFDVLRAFKDEFGGSDKMWSLEDAERLALAQVPDHKQAELRSFFDRYLRGHEAFDFSALLAPVGMDLVKLGDGFPEARLNLGGQCLVSDGSGELRCEQPGLDGADREAGRASFPALGLSLSRGGNGELKLSSVAPQGPAAREGLADFLGQVAQSATAGDGFLELTFSQKNMFSGAEELVTRRVEAEPPVRYELRAVDETPDRVRLRGVWL